MFGLDVNVVWAVTTIGKVVVAVCAIRGRHHYPFFATFCWASLLLSCALWALALGKHDLGYFWTYYSGNIAKDLLFLCCVYEVAVPMFFPWWILPKAVAHVTLAAFYLAALVSIALAVRFPTQDPQRLVASARTLDKSATVFFLVAVLAAVALSSYLNVRWQKRAAFIIAGFAIFLFVDSAVFVALTHGHVERLQCCHLLGYLIAEAVWVVGMLREEPPAIRLNDAQVRKLCSTAMQTPALRKVG